MNVPLSYQAKMGMAILLYDYHGCQQKKSQANIYAHLSKCTVVNAVSTLPVFSYNFPQKIFCSII